jgi:hypothetical protein
MGKKKKDKKKLKKALKKERKVAFIKEDGKGCKPKCCKKYKKSESKRCKRCPCFDLLKKQAA